MKKYCWFFLCFLLFSCIYDSFLSRYGEEWMAEQTGRPSSTNSTTTTSLNNSSDNGGSSSSDNTTTTSSSTTTTTITTTTLPSPTTTTTSTSTTTTTSITTTTTTIHVVAVGDVAYSDGTFSSNTDIDNAKTIIGVVFQTDGEHGKMIYKTGSRTQWCQMSADGFQKEFNTSLSDGSLNWDIICNAVTDGNVAGKYPVFDYVNGLGNNWYLPAYEELIEIRNNSDAVYDTLKKLYYSVISFSAYYWSSSTLEDGSWRVYLAENENQVLQVNGYRNENYEVRAIKKF